MDEELNLDLDNIESNVENKLKVKNRIEQLSEKVILTSKERDELVKTKGILEGEKTSLTKQIDFYKSFSTISSKHPEAINYQDQILEKVNKGYDPEDAALAILAKEGKLTNQTQAPVQQTDVAGGSAQTILQGNKNPNEMKMDEKFEALSKLSNDDLARAFRG